MSDTTVMAVVDFTHEGHVYGVGDTFTVRPVEAAILRRQGRVALASDEDLRTRVMHLLAERQPVAAPRRRRTYRRRDLSAE